MLFKWLAHHRLGKTGGQVRSIVFIPIITVLAAILVLTFLPIIGGANVSAAISNLESKGYVVLTSAEYNTLNTKLDNIKISADAAVINANAAVIAANNAVTAAQIAAAKVDLFNSAEVFLFPNTTNVTITLTAGNTNVWSNWVEVVDSTNITLSSKFSIASGYINDMYIYDHSAVDKLYCIELSYGVAKTTLGRMMWHTSFKDAVQIKSRRVPSGETIYYRMMCSGVNGSTAKVGFRYFYE